MTTHNPDLRDLSDPADLRPRSAVWYLFNPADDPAVPAALDTPHTRAARILLVRLAPGSRTRADLAVDVARTLGVTSRDIDGWYCNACAVSASACWPSTRHTRSTATS
jgi:hypothetical protein